MTEAKLKRSDSFIVIRVEHLETYRSCQWLKDDKFLNNWLDQNKKDSIRKIQLKKEQNKQYYFAGGQKKGLAEGRGFFYQPNKILYQGMFKQGYPEAQGVLLRLSSNSVVNNFYEGQFFSGQAHGIGTYHHNQFRYKLWGTWQNSKPINAQYTFEKDPIVKKITFNKKKDEASIQYTDLRFYTGKIDFCKLCPHKEGSIKFSQTSPIQSYTGEWRDGEIQGSGEMKWKDGSKYVGLFKKGLKHGKGEYFFSSKKRFCGFWREGKRNGKGILYEADGKQVVQGLWKNDCCYKQLTTSEMNEEYRRDQKTDNQNMKNPLQEQSLLKPKLIKQSSKRNLLRGSAKRSNSDLEGYEILMSSKKMKDSLQSCNLEEFQILMNTKK